MDYVDSYYARTLSERSQYPSLDGDLAVETLVIGGGLAGCATALDLAERGRSVALIEANRIGWGASGRNVGFASEGFPKGYELLVKRVGRERAREIQKVAQLGLRLVRQRIAEYAIDCGPNQEGALRCNIAGHGDDLPKFRDFMAENFGVQFEYWPRERVREALSTERYTDALFVPTTMAVHPLNLNLGLARACVERGGQIFQETRARGIAACADRHEVRTASGRIRAEQIVITCGGYIDGLERSLSWATIPIATFVMATEPLGAHLRDAIRVPYAIFDNQTATNYYRPLADTRVLWGGRVLVWELSPAKIAALLKRDMVQFYPALKDAKVEVAWGGMMPMTRHRIPVIGQVAPNVWYATGFGGLGVTLTSAFGRLIAEAITEGDDRWRLFGDGLPFAAGKFGRIPAQLVYWSHQFRAG
ncbi:MAG TPA: FAD-binding oxidoreductase [Acetobacteraceae bacterium]